jgi:hypothetical protein
MPRRQMLAKWLVNASYSGTVDDYYTLPEKYIYAKIAVASGATRSEYDYISLPDRYTLSDIYKAVSGSSADTIDRGEKEALGWIAAAVRGDASDPVKVATYINWPWRYQVASIITALAVDSNAQSFITASGATDVRAIDQFVKGVKALGLYDSMVCWPLRSSQNSGTGTTAYSIGGLGTFNGTLVGGPAWGAGGIVYDGVDDRITTAFTQASTQVFCGVVGNMPTAGSKGIFYGGQNSVGQEIYWTNPRTGFGGEFRYGGSNLTIADNAVSGVHMWSAIGAVGSGTKGYRSTTLLGTAGANATTPSPFSLGSALVLGRGAGLYQGTAAFAFVIHSSPSSPNSFYNLYKQTLGTGLGLP